MTKKTKLTLTFLPLLAIAICTAIFLWPKPDFTYADEVYEKCKNEHPDDVDECISEKVNARVFRNPQTTKAVLDQLYQGIKTGWYDLDGRILTTPAHYAGMILATKDFELREGFELCSDIIKQGCIHGMYMEYVEIKKIKDAATMKKLCEEFASEKDLYLNCIHGIGHELVAVYYNGSNLKKVLNKCDYDDKTAQSYCVSGVFMEYSAWEGIQGYHSHGEVFRNVPMCEEYAEKYQETCAYSVASYAIIYPGERLSYSIDYCRDQNFADKETCLLYAMERLIISSAENPHVIDESCKLMLDMEYTECMDLTYKASKKFFDNKMLSWQLWLKNL